MTKALVAALRDPACYPHPAAAIELVETHISWVLLAGDYAYKLKKPVRLAFLDFSTLEARRRYCEEEVRLNRRTAAAIYLDVVPIVQTGAGPRVSAPGTPVEHAVRMRRFPGDALAAQMARSGKLGAPECDRIAAAVAAFHAAAPRADADGAYGRAQDIAAFASGNFDEIAALSPCGGADAPARLARLQTWTTRESLRLHGAFEARRAGGFVRECHGDLHLGNIVFLGGEAVPFDCIEFDPALRWIDIAGEVAFLYMDLLAHRMAPLAWRLLDAWLEATGDYAGVELLGYYAVYRAMVRAKVACIGGDAAAFAAYLELADVLTAPGRPALVLMHGVSGSGKSVASQALLEGLGAVRVRSDVERKRMHGLAPAARAGAAPGEGIYDAASTQRTYERLAAIAAAMLRAGCSVIVDAANLKRAQRDGLRRVAEGLHLPCAIVSCEAPDAVLRERIARRASHGSDASDAGLAILDAQLGAREPLSAEEAALELRIDTQDPAAVRVAIDAIRTLAVRRPAG